MFASILLLKGEISLPEEPLPLVPGVSPIDSECSVLFFFWCRISSLDVGPPLFKVVSSRIRWERVM